MATFRIAYGTLSPAYNDHLITDLKLKALDQGQYFEYGIGLENLGLGQARIFCLDYIWQGLHKSLNGPRSLEFGVRLSVKPTF